MTAWIQRVVRTQLRGPELLNWCLLVGMTAVALVHANPGLFLDSLGRSFVALAAVMLAGSAISHWLSKDSGTRIQGPRRGRSMMLLEAYESTRAMYTVACIAAWPVTQIRLGEASGLVWSMQEAGGGFAWIAMQFVLGVIIADAWTYWKHRLLHTRLLFGFHRQHHAFRDPTPFAGFAISPVEAVLTFCPIFLLCWPAATHYAPMYFGMITAFVGLNFYLHCGVTYRLAEWVLPKMLLNSSAHHNLHHARANVNFGEVGLFWDWLCRTSRRAKSSH